tara:strand:+ start:3316 stop:4761 length:1446 start_codon:yes stop_codon:yes gene_type:complete
VTTERPLRVLIVDDNRDLAENLAELFEELEVETAIAGSAAQARDLLDERTALALVDVGLPDANGLELLEPLRALNPAAEILLMTGQGTLETAIAAVRHGAYAYLLKPVDVDDLLALAERALAQVQLRGERTALARALAASEAIYRGVVDNVEAWIVGIGSESKLVFANRRAAEGLEGVLSSGDGSVQALGEPFESALGALLRDGEVPAFETTVQHPAAGERIIRWQLTHVPETRTAVDVLAMGLDVTEQRTLEHRSARAEAMAAIGVLTTGLAHEIRNPLNAASLQLQLLSRRLAKVDVPRRDKLTAPVELVRHELARLSSLLDDFLGLARPASLRTESVDLQQLVQQVARLEAPVCAERGIRLEVEAPAGLMARGEPGRLEQVLVNLVANAADALDGEPGRIRVRAERNAGGVTLTVEDSGPGFGETSEKLLEPFFTTKAAGTGLGLTIVRRIVELHEGELRLGSSDLGGAAVRIDLAAG